MIEFRGDLLMGGTALRDLHVSMIQEEWKGRFQAPKSERQLLEIGRPYLLMLEDGRSGRVIVTRWEEQNDKLAVEFCPCN